MRALPDILSGLQTRLATIPNLRTSDTWPETVNPPAAWCKPETIRPMSLTRATWVYRLELWLAVGAASFRSGQEALNTYLDAGASNLETALFADETLGGAASGILLFDLDRYQMVEIDGRPLLAAVFNIEVMA